MTPEENGAKNPSPETKDQELKSNEQESATNTSSELSPEEVKSQNTGRNRIIFLALLDSAMRYREGYFREELEEYKDYLEGQVDVKMKDLRDKVAAGKTLNERGTRRRIEKSHEDMFITFKNRKEKFNDACYREVENIVSEMTPASKANFDNYATGFGLLCEELLKAKNTSELLTVCKLYNQGLMDNAFAEIKKKREDEKITPTDNVEPVAPVTDTMQEEPAGAGDDSEEHNHQRH